MGAGGRGGPAGESRLPQPRFCAGKGPGAGLPPGKFWNKTDHQAEIPAPFTRLYLGCVCFISLLPTPPPAPVSCLPVTPTFVQFIHWSLILRSVVNILYIHLNIRDSENDRVPCCVCFRIYIESIGP